MKETSDEVFDESSFLVYLSEAATSLYVALMGQGPGPIGPRATANQQRAGW